MKRVQLFEFEDQTWFPGWIRVALTNLIIVLSKMMKMDQAIANVIQKAMDKKDYQKVTDFGSGSGGVMPMVVERLRANGNTELQLELTDL